MIQGAREMSGRLVGRVDQKKKHVYCNTEWTWCGTLFDKIHCKSKSQNTVVHSSDSCSVNVFSPVAIMKHIHHERRHVMPSKDEALNPSCTIFYTDAVFK